MVRLVEAGPLHSAQEVADFLDASPTERALIIASYKSAGVAPTASSWDKFVAVMGVIVNVAGAVTGITSAISGVYGVIKL
jgi:hypothetical protein